MKRATLSVRAPVEEQLGTHLDIYWLKCWVPSCSSSPCFLLSEVQFERWCTNRVHAGCKQLAKKLAPLEGRHVGCHIQERLSCLKYRITVSFRPWAPKAAPSISRAFPEFFIVNSTDALRRSLGGDNVSSGWSSLEKNWSNLKLTHLTSPTYVSNTVTARTLPALTVRRSSLGLRDPCARVHEVRYGRFSPAPCGDRVAWDLAPESIWSWPCWGFARP